MKNLVLLGAPGSGKGTQSASLSSQMDLQHISTGEILRAEVQSGTDLGQEVEPLLAQGSLVSDEIIFQVLERFADTVQQGLLFDGLPRSIKQAEYLDQFFAKREAELTKVVVIDVDQSVLEQRLVGRYICTNCSALYNDYFKATQSAGVCDKCGGTEFSRRSDDNIDSVKKRLLDNQLIQEKLCSYYLNKGLLARVNGMQEAQKVTMEIVEILQGDN